MGTLNFNGRTQRERVWDVLRGGRPLTIKEIALYTDTPADTVRTYLHSLRKGGYVRTEAAGRMLARSDALSYVLVRDTGREAPVLDRSGNPLPTRVNDAMWLTLRMMRQVNASELSAVAGEGANGVSLNTAKTWLHMLHKAGYLDEVVPGGPGRQAVFRLKEAMNTGPKSPQIQRVKAVWDANLGLLMYREPCDRELETAT